MQQQKESELRTLLQADVAALELWMDGQEDYVEAAAGSQPVRQAVSELVKLAAGEGVTKATLLQATQKEQLEAALRPWLHDVEHIGYVVLDEDARILASDEDSLVGLQSPTGYVDFTKSVLQGKPLVTRPFPSTVVLTDEWGNSSAGVPTMFAAAPVKDGGESVAVIGFRHPPDRRFHEDSQRGPDRRVGRNVRLRQVRPALCRQAASKTS